MSWLRTHRRTAVLLGLTLVLPIYLYLQTVFGLLGLAFEYRGDAGRITPRLERLQGLENFEEQLREQQSVAKERLDALVYPPEQDGSALAALLQSEVRQLLTREGMTVSNSQVLPVRQDEVFDRVAVKLTVSGSLGALDAALRGIADARPRIVVESLDTFPERGGRRGQNAGPSQTLTAVMQLMVLRALP